MSYAILDFAGWAFFYLLLVFYVLWIALEREFFSRRDWETCLPRSSPQDYSLDDGQPAADSRVLRLLSSGMPQ